MSLSQFRAEFDPMPEISSFLERPVYEPERCHLRHGEVTQVGGRPPLSSLLRGAGEAAHRAVEKQLDFPGRIKNRDDYAACLGWFYAVIQPLEDQLGGFSEWPEIGIDLQAHRRAALLVQDLAMLGTEANRLAVAETPCISSFSEALGVLYVLQGSALGGRVIIADVERRLGPVCAGAAAFFSAPNLKALSWPRFKAVIDAYGEARPSQQPLVVSGMLKAFAAFAAAARDLTP